LETASIAPNAAIVQLAAYTSDMRCFNQYISLASCEAAKLDVSTETMDWWSKQDPALRNRVFGGNTSVKEAVENFIDWCNELCGGDYNRIVLWGNGVDFDNTILKSAIEVFYSWPFSYRNQHHLRTLLALTPLDVCERMHNQFDSNGDKHDALEDARYQYHMTNKALLYHGY